MPASAPAVPPEPPHYRPRGGIGIGVILIAIGVVFLIAQFIPGIVWWQMWPLLVILVGGIQIITPDPRSGWGVARIMDGIGTLIVGFVLLGNTTGVISWGVWWTILTLWPVLLVAIGLGIIGRAIEQTWVRALAPVVIWIAFAYAVATSLTGVGGIEPIRSLVPATGQSFDISKPRHDVTRATFLLNGGAGDITIAEAHGALVTASGRSPFGTPVLSVNRDGTNADVRFGLGNQKDSILGSGFAAGSVDIGLSDAVLWDAVLQAGATNLSADFTHVKLHGLTLRTGASGVNLKLGDVPRAVTKDKVAVKAGVSTVNIAVPKDAAVRIVARDGLSSTNVVGDFARQGDGSWETPGFASESHAYEISIESGVGSVSIKQE